MPDQPQRPPAFHKEFLPLIPKVKETARALGIKPELLFALIQRESVGDQRRVSSKGAVGLTQLLPSTAKEMGLDPLDAEQNIKGGATFLKKMLDRFGGKEDLALAAYNAGPRKVKGGKIPAIPETQNYVKSIQANAPYYATELFPATEAARHNAYGEGNINLFSRPISKNADGSKSTLNSLSGEVGGKEVLVPGVDAKGGGIISPKKSFDQFFDTGRHLGKFDSVPEANRYAENLHIDSDKGFYTPPLVGSRQEAAPNRLGNVLDFMLRGERNTFAPDKTYFQKMLEHGEK